MTLPFSANTVKLCGLKEFDDLGKLLDLPRTYSVPQLIFGLRDRNCELLNTATNFTFLSRHFFPVSLEAFEDGVTSVSALMTPDELTLLTEIQVIKGRSSIPGLAL